MECTCCNGQLVWTACAASTSVCVAEYIFYVTKREPVQCHAFLPPVWRFLHKGDICGQAVKKPLFTFSEACVDAFSHQAKHFFLVSLPSSFLMRMLKGRSRRQHSKCWEEYSAYFFLWSSLGLSRQSLSRTTSKDWLCEKFWYITEIVTEK